MEDQVQRLEDRQQDVDLVVGDFALAQHVLLLALLLLEDQLGHALGEQLDAALEVAADGLGEAVRGQARGVDGPLELLAAGDAEDEVVEPVRELEELGVRRVVFDEAGLEVDLESFEQ